MCWNWNLVSMIPSPNASRKLAIDLRDWRMPAAAGERITLVFAALFGILLLVLVVIPAMVLIVIWFWEASTLEAIVGLILFALFTVGYFSLIYFAESHGLAFRSRK